MSHAIVALVAGVLGLILGSFANVVIYRVPAGQSIVTPPSACPDCGARIKPWHNVPVLGWLVLRGRCASCGVAISRRYPLIEAFMGLAFAAIGLWVGLSSHLPLLLVLAFFSFVLGMIDFDTSRLPDPIVAAFAVLSLVAVVPMVGSWSDAARIAIGVGALGLFYALSFFLYPRGMGWGDVKLSLVLGGVMAAFGWDALLVGAFAAFLWGTVVGVGVMVVTRRRRGVRIPFGPWMFAGAWTGIVAGAAVAGWYLSVVGLT